MRIISSVAGMQKLAKQWQRRGRRIGFVPTMGYLHEGHISLTRVARQRVGKMGVIVVSIYVNPTQFGPKEDLSRYPRDFERDCKLCRAAGVDVIFAPTDTEMYKGKSEGLYSTYVVEENLSQSMEGAARPTHFRGVTTIVAKLFNAVLPDVAVFGAKDWQQAAVIQRMVADLNFPVRIIVAETIGEADGLAMSSRNKYLDAEQRKQATILSRAIKFARDVVKRKPLSAAKLKAQVKKFISTAPLGRIDYVEFFEPETLQPAKIADRGTHMALAVFFGKTRLIDNGRL